MATLLFKVGALTVRTIAKPLSSSIERLVMSNEGTRKVVVNVAQVCIPPASCERETERVKFRRAAGIGARVGQSVGG